MQHQPYQQPPRPLQQPPQQAQWAPQYQSPPQWSQPSSTNRGCVPVFIAGLIVFWLMTARSLVLNGNYTNLLVFTVIVGGILAFAIAWLNRKNAEQAHWMVWQQQQAARQAWEQMERERLEMERRAREQQERERQERERQERERQERERQDQERLRQAQTLEGILMFSPYEFEEFTGRLLQYWGYQNVQQVGGSGDLGVDLTAIDGQGELVVVQCKRYAPENAISSPALQKFIGMMNVHHGASNGIFVTTSRFTQPAIDLAAQHSIELFDGERLVQSVQSMPVP